jgi:hypothetical protein
VARRPKRLVVAYDDLYLFFAHTLGHRERSSFIYPRWTTKLDTSCGIYLYRPPLLTGGYWCTPANSVEFAYTGGEGCHFSFLLSGRELKEPCPVVMTCPGAGSCRNNVIVGEDLMEFLCLGLRTGYFVLENLANSAEDFDAQHPFVSEFLERKRLAPWVKPEQAAIVKQMSKRFGLLPLEKSGSRLAELQRRYISKLAYGDEFYETLGIPRDEESSG